MPCQGLACSGRRICGGFMKKTCCVWACLWLRAGSCSPHEIAGTGLWLLSVECQQMCSVRVAPLSTDYGEFQWLLKYRCVLQ
mmetsp:Transcript_140143/g.349251  ORF Transcript_140143/g.349251 Transcript_140143/m.349251 type:complete len:82 (-) Transcript_140143:72-317(-)